MKKGRIVQHLGKARMQQESATPVEKQESKAAEIAENALREEVLKASKSEKENDPEENLFQDKATEKTETPAIDASVEAGKEKEPEAEKDKSYTDGPAEGNKTDKPALPAVDAPKETEDPVQGMDVYFKAYPDKEFFRTTDGQVFHAGHRGRSLAMDHQSRLNGKEGNGKVETIKRK